MRLSLFLMFTFVVFGQEARHFVLFDHQSYAKVLQLGRKSFQSLPERKQVCPSSTNFEWLLTYESEAQNGVEKIAVVTTPLDTLSPCGNLVSRRISESSLQNAPMPANAYKAKTAATNQLTPLEQVGLSEQVLKQVGKNKFAWSKLGYVFLDSGFSPHHCFDPSRIDSLIKNVPDIDGHGTAVTGIGAANCLEVTGISQQAMIVPFQVNKRDPTGIVYTDQVSALRAILSLRNLPYELLVVNMSFGIWELTQDKSKWDVWGQVLYSMRDRALFFASSGNDKHHKTENMQPCSSSLLENVVCVGGVDKNNSFFQTGTTPGPHITMSAPWDAFTTLLAGPNGLFSGWRSGTSISSPFCSGAGVLVSEEVYGEFPNAVLTPKLLKGILMRALTFAPELLGQTGIPGVLNVEQGLKVSRDILANTGQLPTLTLGRVDGVLGSWSGKSSLARGDLVSVYGKNLNGYQVYLNARKLELSYTSDTQLNFTLPQVMFAYRTPNVLAMVKSVNGKALPETVQILSVELSTSESLGIGGIYRENGQITENNPARVGDQLTIFISGTLSAKSATVLLGGTSITTELKERFGNVRTVSFSLPILPAQHEVYGKILVNQSQENFAFNYDPQN